MGYKFMDEISEEEAKQILGNCEAGQDGHQEQAHQRALITKLSDIEAVEVNWLWKPYIPLGKLTLLEGDPSVGKTWLALQIAATISRGGPFPSPDSGKPEGINQPGNILYLSAEDGLADTLRPRLDNLGANVEKVFMLTGSRGEDGKLNGVSLKDLETIEEALQRIGPSLLVVDPLQAYLGASVDMHRANEVRPLLAGLANLAEKYNTSALCIRHLSKAPQGRAIYRGMGSIDFAAAARSILLVGQDPDNERKRGIVQTKSSLEEAGPSIGYEIVEGVLYWTGLSDMTAQTIFKPEQSDEERTALQVAKDFLEDILQDGSIPSEEVFKEAKSQKISDRTLHRAKADMGVISKKVGLKWFWDMPGSELELEV